MRFFRLLSHHKRDQHAGPDNVQKMPVAGAVINRPVAFVVVAVTKRLVDNEAKKDHPADHMKCVNEGKRETHPVDFHRTVGHAEVLRE